MNFIFQKILHSVLILSLSVIHSSVGTESIKEILDSIPKNEKEDLERLFHSLFSREFAYTLFADKPMSLATYSIKSFDSNDFPSNKKLRYRKRWEVWKKYSDIFPIKRYLLTEVPFGRNCNEIYLINKKHFIDKVDEHLDLFKKALGENITGALLLKKIEENHKFLSFFDEHQMLFGIMLGYGVHNARLYEKRYPLSFFVYKKEFPKIPIKIPDPSDGFSSLKDEFNSYFSLLTLFGDSKYSPLMIRSVQFVADHTHPETIALQKKYREQRGKISAIYANGNFLEITLSQLTSDIEESD